MKTCPTCQSTYSDSLGFCPHDGAGLRAAGELEPGTIIRKKYQILEEIARGGMGVVYRVRHLIWKEDMAIKLLLRAGGAGDQSSRGFLAEAVTLRQLQHPNIVRVEDADFTEDDKLFVVMEYVAGKSLRQRIREGRVAWREALRIAAQACAGLAAAHEKGIIHRDIKPENLLLANGADGREMVKVIDFGIAKVREYAGLGLTGAATSQTGLFMGTPEYASPEQATGMRGSELDGRTDIYSLGLVLYEMLTGSKPFEADSVVATLLSRLQHESVSPRVLHPELDIPRPVSDLVAKATAREKEQRFGSVEEMRVAILGLIGDNLPAPVQPPLVRKKRSSNPLLAGSIATAAALAVAAWFLWPRPKPAPPPEPVKMAIAVPAIAVPKAPEPAKPPVKPPPAKPVVTPPPPKAAPPLATGNTKVNAADGLRYVWIGPGKFTMGCSSGDTECETDENPPHSVTLSKGFWIGETEVTQAAYEHLIGRNPSEFKGPDLPVDSVSWFQANAYCQAAGMRLPAEAEWEWAARGGGGNARNGRPIEIAWWLPNSNKTTHPVAQKKQNGYGLYDMLGNVAEWTADWFSPYTDAAATDPHGPDQGEFRVMRGGSWAGGIKMLRVSTRLTRRPGFRGNVAGFRCAGD